MYPALFNFFSFFSFFLPFFLLEYSHGLTGPYSCPYANGYRWNNRIFFLITSLFLLALPVFFLVQKKLCTARSVVLVVDGVDDGVEIVVDDVFRNAVGRRRRRGVEVEGVVDVGTSRRRLEMAIRSREICSRFHPAPSCVQPCFKKKEEENGSIIHLLAMNYAPWPMGTVNAG